MVNQLVVERVEQTPKSSILNKLDQIHFENQELSLENNKKPGLFYKTIKYQVNRILLNEDLIETDTLMQV